MSVSPDKIFQLSNAELRQELLRIGITPAPLTPTTRKLYQKKLAQKLCLNIPISVDQEASLKNNVNDDKARQETNQPTCDGTVNTPGGFVENGDDIKRVTSAPQFYYVVTSLSDNDKTSSKIFDDRAQAMKTLQSHKDSRFQRFSSLSQAQDYVENHSRLLPSTVKTSNCVSEKANEFPAPKQVQLTQLMRSIEANDHIEFEKLVWKNPRFLISAADGPVPLKASMRYNALHVASRANRPSMVRNILSSLEDPNFQELMYSNSVGRDEGDAVVRTQHVIDSYLNTPEKGCFDTPLHIACKFAFPDVVAELVSHPLCDKTIVNKEGKSPADVVCSRCKSNKGEIETLRQEILFMLADHYYVPLYRHRDNTFPPTVGAPWSPSEPLKSLHEPPHIPTAPNHMVSAIAGPMSLDEAHKLHHDWSSPNRKDPKGRHRVDIRLRDMDKGEERVGREVTHLEGHQWWEYWDFLGAYTDLGTEDGLSLFEEYLRNRKEAISSSLSSSNDSFDDLSRQMSLMRLSSPINSAVSDGIPQKKNVSESPEIIATCPSSTPIKSLGTPRQKSGRLELVKSAIKRRQLQRALFSPPNGATQRLSLSLPTPTSSNPGLLLSNNSIDCEFTKSSPMFPDSPSERLKSLFIIGNRPTKLDHDVFIALGGVGMDPLKYPLVCEWTESVTCYPESERQRWRTPRRQTCFPPTTMPSSASPISHLSAHQNRKELPRILLSFSEDKEGVS